MQASGNDFVVVDNRKKIIPDARVFTQKVCAPHTGIGADGVLLFENSKKANFRMRIINSDGSEAEACGNGFRCIALYARNIFHYPEQFHFESGSGIIKAHLRDKKIRVQLVTPTEIRLQNEIDVLGHRLHYSFINTGVPHTVVFVEGLAKIDVENLGRAIRRHKKFQPKGTNVNFVEVAGRKEIHARTYERGVEKETLACGTGSTAAAVISALSGYTEPPVKVKTQGSEILTIDFKRKGNKITDVTLEGEAHFVYEGKMISM